MHRLFGDRVFTWTIINQDLSTGCIVEQGVCWEINFQPQRLSNHLNSASAAKVFISHKKRTCRKNFCSSCLCSRVFLVWAYCIKKIISKLLHWDIDLHAKIEEIPWEIFGDVDIWPLEQLCLAQHLLAVLYSMTRSQQYDWHGWTDVVSPWSCWRWRGLDDNLVSRARWSIAPTRSSQF